MYKDNMNKNKDDKNKDDDQDKKFIGDEFEEVEETTEDKNLENLFDLVIPPGMPQKIIMEAADKFNLEISTRKVLLRTVDTEKENLLILRGRLDDVNNAHDYIYQKLSEKYGYSRQTR